MKKRALIIRNAFSYDFGGGERFPTMLAQEISKNDYAVCVGTNHRKIRLLANQLKISNIWMPWLAWQNFSGWRLLFFPIYLVWQIWLLVYYLFVIVTKGYDVLHIQSRDDFIAGTIAGKLLGKTVIWTDHADLKYVFKNLDVFNKNPIGKMVYFASRFAKKIIVVSKQESSLIDESTSPRKLKNVEIIYNGITDKKVSPKRDFDKKTTLFVLTSRLVATKGIGEVIGASKMLDEDGYDHRVLLLGEGPEEDIFRKMAGKSVVFMDFPDDALSYVAGADVFIHPSYNEGFSLSLVEAAMLSKPTIATDVGGNPEIIKNCETGILIKPKDANSLYAAMKDSIQNTETFVKYGKALRKSYENNFQFDKIVKEQILPLYNKK